MSRTVLIACLTASLWLAPRALADHVVMLCKSVPFASDRVTERREIFFGEPADYRAKAAQIARSAALHGAMGLIEGTAAGAEAFAKGLVSEGLKGAGAGLGIGLVIGALDPFVMSLYADQHYLRVDEVRLDDGTLAWEARFFIGDKHPAYAPEEIRQIIAKETP